MRERYPHPTPSRFDFPLSAKFVLGQVRDPTRVCTYKRGQFSVDITRLLRCILTYRISTVIILFTLTSSDIFITLRYAMPIFVPQPVGTILS